MNTMNGALRNHLDPRGLLVLKKRLVSGDITPRVFKDILRRQMVQHFFKTYRHPLALPWWKWRGLDRKKFAPDKNTKERPGKSPLETVQHKRFR